MSADLDRVAREFCGCGFCRCPDPDAEIAKHGGGRCDAKRLTALLRSVVAAAVAVERERCAEIVREDCHECGRCGDEDCDCAMNEPKEPIRASPCCGRCGPPVWDILEPDHEGS